MLRLVLLLFLIGTAATLNAQTPAASATSTPTPTASPTPTPTSRSLIDSLSTGDVQKAIDLLKTNYINPDALNDAEIDRSKLEGLLTRLGRGAALTSTAEANAPAASFYSDVLSGRVAYLRLGDMTRPNLDALDKALSGDGAKKIDAAVIDLRASTS